MVPDALFCHKRIRYKKDTFLKIFFLKCLSLLNVVQGGEVFFFNPFLMIQCKKERFEITLYKYSVPLYVCVHMDSAMTKYWPFSDFSDHQTNFIII